MIYSYAFSVMDNLSQDSFHLELSAPDSVLHSTSISDFENAEIMELRDSNHRDNEISEMNSVPQRSLTSISLLYSICILRMNSMISLAANASQEADMQDQRGRLQIWAGNHGAYRTPNDRMSLDYRLREAQDLHQGVTDHFNDLIRGLKESKFHRDQYKMLSDVLY